MKPPVLVKKAPETEKDFRQKRGLPPKTSGSKGSS